MSFKNKKVIISGAYGMMAEQMIKILTAKGAHIFALDLSLSKLNEKYGDNPNVSSFQVDISQRAQLKEVCKDFNADYLVNHTGVTNAHKNYNLFDNDDIWDKDIEINLTGTFNLTAIFLKSALKQKRSVAIVTIGSVNSDMYYSDPVYSAAKAGLVNFTKTIAANYGANGVRANVVSPASVMTAGWKARLAKNPNLADKIKKWYPLGKLVTPEAIAKATVFLLSDSAEFITGINLRVDAGLSAGNMVFSKEITET